MHACLHVRTRASGFIPALLPVSALLLLHRHCRARGRSCAPADPMHAPRSTQALLQQRAAASKASAHIQSGRSKTSQPKGVRRSSIAAAPPQRHLEPPSNAHTGSRMLKQRHPRSRAAPPPPHHHQPCWHLCPPSQATSRPQLRAVGKE